MIVGRIKTEKKIGKGLSTGPDTSILIHHKVLAILVAAAGTAPRHGHGLGLGSAFCHFLPLLPMRSGSTGHHL